MIGIIDYDAGNIKSVSKAIERLGSPVVISADHAVLDGCDALILPGVGSFGKAVENLEQRDLISCIHRNAASGKLLLGICLGMQLLYDTSYEDGVWQGLGLLPGTVKKFGQPEAEPFPVDLKIPHMGWNQLVEHRRDEIGDGLPQGSYTYFVHSYYAVPGDWDHVVYFAEYGVRVPAVVRRNNVIGMQFHPEKSSQAGLQLLSNFLKMEKPL